jgi:pseudaminic acid cytidylyltransferase
MRLAVIPARGGSQRIPRKNIRPFHGRPIISYAITAALAAGCFDEVMVSTDDNEIATVARAAGAAVPFMRSPQNASHTATTADVLLEVLRQYEGNGRNWTELCCLYPTAPFVTPEALNAGLEKLTHGASGVISVVRFSYPIQRALRITNGQVSMFHPEHLNSRSQDLEPAYHDAGQFYWAKVPAFVSSGTLMGPGVAALELPESAVQDIDTEEDWALAELKFQRLGQRERAKP